MGDFLYICFMETTLTKEIKDTVLYIHTRKSDGGIFYVGIGDEKRPYQKRSRNKYWRNTVKVHGGFNVTILKTGMTWEEACDLEIKMISFYGRKNPDHKNPNYGCLVNMTDGGDGSKGCIPSEETKQKRRESMTGKMVGENHPMFGKTPSEETRQKQRESMTGKMAGEKNPNFGKTGEKNPNFGNGDKIRGEKNPMKRDEVKAKFRGENNPFYKKTHTEESKKKMRENHADQYGEKNPRAKKIICVVTNKIYGCIKDAAKDIGVHYETLSRWLNGKRPNKSSLRFL
jgi:group I intron endonuclease